MRRERVVIHLLQLCDSRPCRTVNDPHRLKGLFVLLLSDSNRVLNEQPISDEKDCGSNSN